MVRRMGASTVTGAILIIGPCVKISLNFARFTKEDKRMHLQLLLFSANADISPKNNCLHNKLGHYFFESGKLPLFRNY